MPLFSSFARVVGDTLAAIANGTSPQPGRDAHASAALSIQELGNGPPRTKLDIAKVHFLLSSPFSPLRQPNGDRGPALPALPPEVVSLVLDCAEYYLCKVSFHFAPTTFINNANELYFRTPPLAGPLERGFLRRVEFRIVSHDQGFSGEPAHMHGTHEGSWTWWEASLDRPEPAEALFVSPMAEAPELEYDGRQDEESTDGGDGLATSVSPAEPVNPSPVSTPSSTEGGKPVWIETGRYELTRNLHAVRRFTEHKITFGPEHPLVLSARRGDSIGVWARTRFPAWSNHVKEVEIKVWQML